MLAFWGGGTEIVRFLVQPGADANKADKHNETSLHRAAVLTSGRICADNPGPDAPPTF